MAIAVHIISRLTQTKQWLFHMKSAMSAIFDRGLLRTNASLGQELLIDSDRRHLNLLEYHPICCIMVPLCTPQSTSDCTAARGRGSPTFGVGQ
jgi:hypothetical protein